jgi:hypothetical protein
MFHERKHAMHSSLLCSSAAGCALLTLALNAGAQQQPGTNVPTPTAVPADGTLAVTPGAPILEEPVIDPRTYRSSLPNTPLLVTGLVTFGASYGASVIAARVSDRESDDKLYYPVVGPWMALNDRDCAAESCSKKTLHTALLVGSGVVQGVGALSMVLSLMIPRKTTHDWYLIGAEDQPNLQVTPLAGSNELGVLALGRF